MEAVVGGHHLRTGRPEHPSHESAASLPSVAPSAAPSATGCAEPTCASIPQSALAVAITEGRSRAREGGRQVHASQTDHPEHESAASTTRVATSATPSTYELRRTKLRKRTQSALGAAIKEGRSGVGDMGKGGFGG